MLGILIGSEEFPRLSIFRDIERLENATRCEQRLSLRGAIRSSEKAKNAKNVRRQSTADRDFWGSKVIDFWITLEAFAKRRRTFPISERSIYMRPHVLS